MALSMCERQAITKKYVREYASAAKKDKGGMLDELVGVTGGSRTNARRAIATAHKRRGPARAVQRKRRARTYGYDALFTKTSRVLAELGGGTPTAAGSSACGASRASTC